MKESSDILRAGVNGARAAIEKARERRRLAEAELRHSKHDEENARGALLAIEKGVNYDKSYADMEQREAMAVHYALNYGDAESREVARKIVMRQDAERKNAEVH